MHITIWTSDKCNLQCRYCYEGKDKPGQIMSEEICKATFSFIQKLMNEKNDEPLSITFHGGEPLLGIKCIEYFVEELRNCFPQCRFSMTTNLTILTKEIEKILVNEIDDLSVSIDGNYLAHNLNRRFKSGQGTYEIVKENSLKLLSQKKNIRARMTVVPENIKNLSENIEHLISIGFQIIEPILDFTNPEWNEDYITVYDQQLRRTADMLEKYQDIDIPVLYSAACKTKNSPCDGGSGSFNIATDGSIYPCILSVHKQELTIGHVNTGIDNKKVKWIQNLNKIKNNGCIGCQRYEYCKSTRCKLVNYINTGSYNTPLPIMCKMENSAVKIAKYYLHKKGVLPQ